ncbi:MAG: bifunctional histidinol-phosphatase/imidazoleglycerol-phosphate dehydratase HisB [Anaerolineae bacterium]
MFIDRDGTLVEEPPDEQVDAVSKVRLVPGVIPALLDLSRAGYRLVLVSNQDGRGTDSFPEEQFAAAHGFILELFASQGIRFEAEFICPHFPEDGCDCRKPRTGLLTRWLTRNPPDLERSCVIGDRETDVELAANLGLPAIRIGDGSGDTLTWPEAARKLLGSFRRATVHRKTKETDITVEVDLDDSTGETRVSTGIGYYDHLLEQVARHGGFRLQLECAGDLHVDEHHTIEDVALALGEALDRALGPRRGIRRYGFVVPMDEAQARVAVDLGGRPWSRFEASLARERVGELPTEMVPHVFRSLSDSLRAAIHVEVTGENAHHQVEAAFKALGRALGEAFRSEGGGEVPSTKGVL